MPFKTALHSVSYAGVWTGQARLMLPDFLRKTKSLGYDGVMLMAKRPHLSLLDFDASGRRRLRDKLASLELELVCLAGYTDFCLGSDRPDIPIREMQILYITELARLARDIGSNLVRVFTGYTAPGVTLARPSGDCFCNSWDRRLVRDLAKAAAALAIRFRSGGHS